MQQESNTLTCLELLDLANKRGLSDSDICNRAKRLGVSIHRTTLWRIRKGKLAKKPYMSTLLKLARILANE